MGVNRTESKPAVAGMELKIDWSMKRLSGSIPSILGNLKELQYLSFFNNGMSGSIPESFANLNELITLDLQRTQLGGPIPEFIGALQKLQFL